MPIGDVLCRQPHDPMIESIFRASFRSFSTFSCVWMMAWLFLSLSPCRYNSLMFTSLVAHANLSHTSTAPRVVLICDFRKLFILQAMIWCACLKSLKSNTSLYMKRLWASPFPFATNSFRVIVTYFADGSLRCSCSREKEANSRTSANAEQFVWKYIWDPSEKKLSWRSLYHRDHWTLSLIHSLYCSSWFFVAKKE